MKLVTFDGPRSTFTPSAISSGAFGPIIAAFFADVDTRATGSLPVTYGAATMGGSLKVLSKGGRVVSCGATSGPKVEVHMNLVFFKGLSILGSTMGGLGEVHEVLAHVAAGRLAPVVDSVLPLSTVAEAHPRLEARGYSQAKIRENLEAEALDVILVEAVQMCPRVDEIDTTGKSAAEVAGMIRKIVEGRLDLPPGQVDWLEEFFG